MAQFRKSKSIGGFRITASKGGLSTSFGAGPARVSLGADGKVRRTVRVPGTGIHDTKVVGSTKRPASAPKAAAASEPVAEILAQPSTAPLASRYQRAYVAGKLPGVSATLLKTMHLDHAVVILEALGVDPKHLRSQGRDGLTGADAKARKAWWAEQGD